jgi:hypothetical protein
MIRIVRALMLLLAGLFVACGSPAGSSPAPDVSVPPTTAVLLPPRPEDLPIEMLDPCTVLSLEQRLRLGVGEGRTTPSKSVPGSLTCQWRRFPEEPQDAYLIAPDPRHGAEYALGSTTGARVVIISGYGAVETQVGSSPQDAHCLLLLDVVAGQNLWVQYDYDGSTVPMTKQLACDKAKVAAEMAVRTLTEQSGG